MKNKIKIAFEVTSTYDRQEFRDLIRKLSVNEAFENCNDYEVELFIVTSNTDVKYLKAIADQYKINHTNIIICEDITDKIKSIIDYNIDIVFENSQPNIIEIHSKTNALGVLVDNTADFYLMGFKYIIKFFNIIKNIQNEKKDC